MPRVEFAIYCQTSGPGVNISGDYETASGAKLKSQVKVWNRAHDTFSFFPGLIN